jgi:hypothetical protein
MHGQDFPGQETAAFSGILNLVHYDFVRRAQENQASPHCQMLELPNSFGITERETQSLEPIENSYMPYRGEPAG